MSVLDKSETFVREKVIAYAKARRCLVIVVDYGGWPDRLFVFPDGKHVWIEFKRPKGGRMHARQGARAVLLTKQNCFWYRCNTEKEGKAIVDLYSAH